MKIEEFVEVLQAVAENKEFKIGYQLLHERRFEKFIQNDIWFILEFMKAVEKAEPADFEIT
jgi:hypothetical protein